MRFFGANCVRKFLQAYIIRSGVYLAVLFAFSANAFAVEFTAIPVPKNVIYAGQIIQDELLRERKVPAGYLNRVSVVVDRMAVVGKVARATLMPNRPISTNHVMRPNVVNVNKPAIMEYLVGSLRITAEVLPLNSAKAGEFVRVRNIQTGVVISGTAQEDGSIAVGIRR